MEILWGYPQDYLWVWDGYGDRNSVPTAALAKDELPPLLSPSHLLSSSSPFRSRSPKYSKGAWGAL